MNCIEALRGTKQAGVYGRGPVAIGVGTPAVLSDFAWPVLFPLSDNWIVAPLINSHFFANRSHFAIYQSLCVRRFVV